MQAATLLRKLRLQEALSEAELEDYLKKLRSDGSLPPDEIPKLLELMTHRTEHLSIEDIKAASSLVGGNSPATASAAGVDECAMRSIVSKLAK
ncbi:hypothetical protein QM467_16645 [Rhodoblastus sp. 17X3]|uniref:hypothetical protein n=1 Tax=Rhodoblastus sp. 17X3 TaxID=3047026 RepID=UPI0024B6D00B|nr:hypothetical protein [Rhodoblastus sp. 17X3]MDI9849678.1 hypothetical protein [Rhodoblastus sp. 17X3]